MDLNTCVGSLADYSIAEWFSKVWSGPAVSASSGSLLEMHILRLTPDLLYPGDWRPSCLSVALQVIMCVLGFGNYGFHSSELVSSLWERLGL